MNVSRILVVARSYLAMPMGQTRQSTSEAQYDKLHALFFTNPAPFPGDWDDGRTGELWHEQPRNKRGKMETYELLTTDRSYRTNAKPPIGVTVGRRLERDSMGAAAGPETIDAVER